MSNPVAVLISDIHYNIHTLELADKAMRQAIVKANELEIPLIVAGDLHDTKANLRGECVTAMIKTFQTCVFHPKIIVGNHDKINEKSTDHSLDFLKPYALIMDKPNYIQENVFVVPYQHDSDAVRECLSYVPKNTILIMHQGLMNSSAGHYIQDKTAISKEDVAGFRVISGHYHTRQTIDLPDGGKWDYIGNPYTLNYGESNDPQKGFQILMDDGSLEFIPTNLRKHIIWNEQVGQQTDQPSVSVGDILWIKMHGTKEQLSNFTKENIPLSIPFKLDLISTDTETSKEQPKTNQTQPQILDGMIDSLTNTSDTRKLRLKLMWKDFINK